LTSRFKVDSSSTGIFLVHIEVERPRDHKVTVNALSSHDTGIFLQCGFLEFDEMVCGFFPVFLTLVSVAKVRDWFAMSA
jgi:hypothetical protein